MNDMESGFTPAEAGESRTEDRAQGDSWHDVPGLQSYVKEIAKVATALSTDDRLAQRVIDGVHRGSSSALEKVFTDIGVSSRVSVATFDGAPPTEATPGVPTTLAKTAAPAGPKSRTITISVGIGPFSISVTVKKESK